MNEKQQAYCYNKLIEAEVEIRNLITQQNGIWDNVVDAAVNNTKTAIIGECMLEFVFPDRDIAINLQNPGMPNVLTLSVEETFLNIDIETAVNEHFDNLADEYPRPEGDGFFNG